MSNTLAIATVTACIRNLLEYALRNDPDDPMDGAEVKLVFPGSPDLPARGAILFLSRITFSAAWQTADLPTRGPSGELIDRPQVGLCLHYLIAVRGNEQSYEPHRIAGMIARVLAVKPMISKDIITATVMAQSSLLALSNLAEAPDLVRVTPEPITTDELSKIWTAYPQASQGPWLAYEATTVVLDTNDAPGPALPVLVRGLYVNAISLARITSVTSTTDPNGPILPGSTIAISGYSLSSGDAVRVFFDGETVGRIPNTVSPTTITIALPNDLSPGTHGIVVSQMATIAGEPRRIADSNFFAFTLSPIVVALAPMDMVSSAQGGSTVWTGRVVVTCSPAVGSDQRFDLLLNGVGDATRAYAFTAARRTGPVPSTTLSVPIHDVPSGNYLARIRIDGAASALVGGGSTEYSGPTVTF